METALGLCTIAITVCIGLIVFTNLSTVKKIAAETAKEEAQKELEKIKSENEKIISEEKKKISEDVTKITNALRSFHSDASIGKDSTTDTSSNDFRDYKVKGIDHLKKL